MTNKEAIAAFYGKALTVNSASRPISVLAPLLADGFLSTGSVTANNNEDLMEQLEFFWQIIPDLKWDPQEIINEGDQYVVRSIATGSPNGNFMGMPTDGAKSFKIITIDIHTIKDGVIQNTHHVEDWATAIQQLKP